VEEADRKKLSAIICAKNEAACIAEVVAGCLEHCGEVLVIDGHSSDGTAAAAEAAGAEVYLDNGKGKGDAIRVGIQRATRDILVFVDADGSHDPADIPPLVAPILAGEADHVSGSRPRGGSDELHGDLCKFVRMIGSDIITLGINYRFGIRLTDSQNGFRAIRRQVAQDLGLQENTFTIEQEMIMKTLRKGYRITEVPAHEYARKHGKGRLDVKKVWPRYIYSWIKYLFF